LATITPEEYLEAEKHSNVTSPTIPHEDAFIKSSRITKLSRYVASMM
jgi:hypothetical protein